MRGMGRLTSKTMAGDWAVWVSDGGRFDNDTKKYVSWFRWETGPHVDRLAFYEDLFADIPDARLAEIASAEKDGRCVVLPVQGDTRPAWVYGDNGRWTLKYCAEAEAAMRKTGVEDG